MNERQRRRNGPSTRQPIEVIVDETAADTIARQLDNNGSFIIDGRMYLQRRARGEPWSLRVVTDHVIFANDVRLPEIECVSFLKAAPTFLVTVKIKPDDGGEGVGNWHEAADVDNVWQGTATG